MKRSTRRLALPLFFVVLPLASLVSWPSTAGFFDEPLVVQPIAMEIGSAIQGGAQVVSHALGAAERPSPRDDGPLLLVAPVAPEGHGGPIEVHELDMEDWPKAVAYQYMAPVYQFPSPRAMVIGRVRRGMTLPSPLRVGKACQNGAWHRVDRGYVCTGDGFYVRNRELPEIDQRPPALDRNVPFAYAEVTRQGAPRFFRLPTESERDQAESAGRPKLDVVERYMVGDLFVAIDRAEETDLGTFVRTVRGRWVHADDIRSVEPSTLVGEPLESDDELPMAFVPGGEAIPLFRISDDDVEEVGEAERYARARVVEERSLEGVDYVVLEGELALRRQDVRLADRVERPEDVDEGARWVHVNLDEQTLVAYEGEAPRFATLVASGKPGWDTPTGLHRIVNKLATTTMSGSDPREGYYEVDDVPWTMFYDKGYAVHGAYWHDAFGSPRSHGCTNLAPADARFIYLFTAPEVPTGWQARLHARGSWIYLTRDEA